MAFITLSGTLLDPNGDLAVGDQIRFTHKSTTGETVQSAVSIITVNPAGTYSLPLQYGLVLVEYKDVRTQQFKNLGVATVNQDNPATSIPELLNALVPVSSAELIEFQAILADCVAAQVAAEAAEAGAIAAESTLTAEKLTTTELIALSNAFPIGTVIKTLGESLSGDGGGVQWVKTIETGIASQSPIQLDANLLNDADGNQWAVVDGSVVNYSGTLFFPYNFGYAGDGAYVFKSDSWTNLTDVDVSPFSLDRPPLTQDRYNNVSNSLWVDKSDLYLATRVFSGETSWSKWSYYLPMTGESITSPEAIYSLKKATQSYAGSCLQVTNSALLNTTDIGFDSNGDLDLNKLNLFLKGAIGFVSIWYDQSGNGHNLTSAAPNMPKISVNNHLNESHSVIFESSVIYNGALPNQEFLNIPVGLSGTQDALSVIALSSPAHTTRDTPIINLDGVTNFALGNRDQNGINAVTCYGSDSPRALTDYRPSYKNEVWAAASGTSDLVMYANDTTTEAKASVTGTAFAGGKLGVSPLFVDGGSAEVTGGFGLNYLAIYKKQINIGDYRNAYRSLAKAYNLKPQERGRLVFDGDSIVEGAFATYFESYPRLISEQLTKKIRYNLVARSGGTSSSQLTNQSEWLTQQYESNDIINAVVYSVGTNDIAALTVQQIIDNIILYVAAATSTGYRVILGTVLPRNGFSGAQETKRLDLNARIKAEFKSYGASFVLPWDEELTMGVNANTSNTLYYVDGTHPTPFGYTLMANFGAIRLKDMI